MITKRCYLLIALVPKVSHLELNKILFKHHHTYGTYGSHLSTPKNDTAVRIIDSAKKR